jgi:hypothetical protein
MRFQCPMVRALPAKFTQAYRVPYGQGESRNRTLHFMEKKTTRLWALEATEAPFPAERAFVVQFRAQADPSEELFVGRVEHMASGAAERFASGEALIAFITKVLAPAASSRRGLSASTTKRGKTT